MEDLRGNELANVIDPVIRFELLHLGDIAVAIPYTTDLHACAAPSLHVRSRIANHQTLGRIGLKDVEGSKDDVGVRLAREAIRSLDMCEVR
jgi:hypothetical protein